MGKYLWTPDRTGALFGRRDHAGVGRGVGGIGSSGVDRVAGGKDHKSAKEGRL